MAQATAPILDSTLATTADQTLCPLLVKADIRVLTRVRVLPIPDLSDIGQSHTR